MSVNDNVDKNILANMRTHYTPLIKEGATDFGNDSVSASIFSAFDTDKSGDLSKSEIDTNLPNLDTIMSNATDMHSDALEYFGDSYTKAAENTDKSSSKTTTEQIIDNNVKAAVQMILDYAKAHPEDKQIQEYAKKAQELSQNGGILTTDIEMKGAIGEHVIDKNDGKQKILIDNRDFLKNLNLNNVLQVVLHELGHAISGDSLDSKQEEYDVEMASRELTSKITGLEIFNPNKPSPIDSADMSDIEAIEKYFEQMDTEKKETLFFDNIESFINQYEKYPEASPGHGLPANAGIHTKYKPKEIVTEGNTTIIKSDVQQDLKGAYIEDHIEYGDETDSNGNKIPVSAKRVITDSDGNIIFSENYGPYDPVKKAFGSRELLAKQFKLEYDLNPKKVMENLNIGFGFN